jgi:hypothetical protein
MTSRLDDAKAQLLRAFEEGEDPGLEELLRRLPEHRDDLLDFWVILAASDHQEDADVQVGLAGPLTPAEEATVRDICLAASLGPEWLDDSVDEGERTLVEVGHELRRVRSEPYRFAGEANPHFQRVAVYAWLVNKWSAADGTTSRLAVQKLAYLLEQGLGFGLFTQHQKHQLGPYDPTARYRDAEPICFRNKYLVPAGKYALGLGPQIGKAMSLAGRYLRDQSVAEAFVRGLQELGLDEWDLETLATVHAVAQDLPPDERSPQSIRSALMADERWKVKLKRSNFTTAKIAEALHRLSLLKLMD